MLQLLLGGSGSGKTTLLYQRIRARAEKGEKSILLVPEQFTSSTEGRIYRELGDALSGMVESFSFTSLAEKILSTEGGAAVQTLSDAGRAVLVRRTLEELQDTVQYYYRHRRSAAFCQMAAQTIDELKSAGLSGQQLAQLAGACGAESGKLSELALIFQGYETLLARSGMDPSDRLELAGARLEEALARHSLPEFLRDRTVFIDEFDTFNAPKKRLLGAMLAALPSVTVALCDDGAPLLPGDLSLFSGAKQVAAQLRQLARKNGAQVAAPELLRQLRARLPGDIGVLTLEETAPRFHARLSCRGKTYVYRVWNSETPNVFERRYVYALPQPLDTAAMQRAAAPLCGTHDYTSFCANRRMKKSAVRTVNAITVERRGEEVRLTFSGDGFLYHMVRILTGTLLEVGLGQRDADTMPAILAARDRSAAGPAAPARGLILWETRYAHTHPEVGEEKRE